MMKLYDIIGDDGLAIVSGFFSMGEARSFAAEHQVPGTIVEYDDPTVPEAEQPTREPQEMTAKWARAMRRAM